MGVPKIASYLKALTSGEYGLPPQISNTVNYLLDSYFAKVDERATRFRREEPWMPGDPDTHIRELWLGCEIHKAVNLHQSYPTFARNAQAWAFTRMFKQWAGEAAAYDVVPFLDQYEFKEMLRTSYTYRIQYEQISIDLGVVTTLPVSGLFFIRHPMKAVNLIVILDLGYNGPGCSVSVMANPLNQVAAEEFLKDFANCISENDIYYLKCLSFAKGYLDFAAIKPTSWEEVVLKDSVKSQIRDNSVAVLDNMEQLSALGMCPNRNIILISPPGMAKTTMFRAISNETAERATRIWCTGKSIKYPDHVTALFEAARALAPCIIFIEDMDLFGRSRSNLHGEESAVLNEFLACLDGTMANAGVVVMASTNDIKSMDEALVNRPGRFSVKVEIPSPDLEDRGKMLHNFLRGLNATPDETVTKDTVKTVLELCEGLTGDYVRELANSTIIKAVAGGRSSGSQVTFCADDINAAAEQVMKNYKIGQQAHKHITSSPVEYSMYSTEPTVEKTAY